MDYEKKYKEALERVRDNYNAADSADININSFKATLIDLFPELKESEDKRVKKAITHILYENYTDAAVIEGVEIAEIVAWLEKQGEQKPNPYSGVSFEYNGHTWGMCARDGGVDIGYDKQLIANINPIREKDEFDNFSKVVDNKPIGYNTGDFIMCTAPNCN